MRFREELEAGKSNSGQLALESGTGRDHANMKPGLRDENSDIVCGPWMY